MSLCWLTIAQIGWGVTQFNFPAFGGMKGGTQKPGRGGTQKPGRQMGRGGRVNCKE